MYTLIISAAISTLIATGVFFLSHTFILALIVGVIFVFAINFFAGKHFMKKLTELFKEVEKEIKADRAEKAVEKLKSGYPYAKWQFFVKEQINAQIGIIYYTKKKFDEAFQYLKIGFVKNWLAMAMLAALYYKNKDMNNVKSVMDKAIKNSPKEGFLYSLYAYYLSSEGMTDEGLKILSQGLKKSPMDDKLESNLDALKNNKKIKMQNYGHIWMQLNIEKMPQGVKPYQALLMNQRFKRR